MEIASSKRVLHGEKTLSLTSCQYEKYTFTNVKRQGNKFHMSRSYTLLITLSSPRNLKNEIFDEFYRFKSGFQSLDSRVSDTF